MKTQLDIENENIQTMITKGVNELQSARETGTVSDLKQSGAILPYYVGDLANALLNYSEQVLSGHAKIKALPAKMLTLLDPRVVAHYTVKVVIDRGGRKDRRSLQNLASALASNLKTEYEMSLLDEEEQKKLISFIDSTGYKGSRKFKVTRDLLNKYHKAITSHEFSFVKLASKAIVLLASTRPVVQNEIVPPICYIKEKQGVESSVVIADWFSELILAMVSKNDGMLLSEYHTPMVEKPIEWTSLNGGGFHTTRFKYPLIKTFVDSEEFKVLPKRTLAAVNRLQGTKWKVNKKVLEVMLAASENDLGWGDLPTTYDAKAHLTPCPHKDTEKEFLSEDQKEERKVWRQQAAPHYAEQESRNSKVLAAKRVLIEAKRFRGFDSIYFSYFLDFRGRIYPKASNLHPQGTDYVKALLQFSEGKPIDSNDAESYFFMQGANSFGHGLDKKTLLEKSYWVKENASAIVKCANNPYDLEGLWHKSDEDPWLFLAFCFEFAEYSKDFMSGDGYFLSHLPIAFDGSCNGLQHLSAMLLDEVGGEAVNLTSKDVKQDIYDTVRLNTISILEASEEALSDSILEFGITRKACKRPVMIVPYAGTMGACRKYISEQVLKEGAREHFGDNFNEALTIYTSAVWEAIGNTIVKGREIMSFLATVAKKVVKETDSHTITWTTPNGFTVHQKRVKRRETHIKTPLGNSIKDKGYIQNKWYVDTEKSDARKHATAIAPNLVHSLDSCHLQETVNSMPEDTSFAMIHDSFGCHASDAHELSKRIRVEFYNMYSQGNVLNDFIAEQDIEELGGLPLKGGLDLALVLTDEFFFS